MESELTSVNVIVLANNHNPAISTKDWLIKKKIFSQDEVREFLNTPVISVFDGKNFFFQVDEKKLQLDVKQVKRFEIKDLSNKIKMYIDSLPETPYSAIGFNLLRTYQPSTSEEKIINQIKNDFCKDIEKIGKKLGDKEFLYGNTFIINYDNIRITIQIKPNIGKESFVLSFNFHRGISENEKDTKIDIIKNFLNQLNNYFNKANEIASSLFSE